MRKECKLLYEGIKFYTKQLLFSKSRFKYLKRFVTGKVLRRKLEEPLKVELVYSIPLNSYIYIHSIRSYFYSGFYESSVTKYLREKAKRFKPCLFVDVGAYVGYYSILMAEEGCDVIAFEPDPRSFVLLVNNVALKGLQKKIVVFNKAVCESDQPILFKFSKSPSESSFTSYLRKDLVEFVSPVPCVTLDSVLSTFEVHNLVLKIDVEGAALQVLKGGMNTIARFRPYIVLEVHRTYESDELLVLSLLRRYGYRWKILEWRNSKNFIVALEPSGERSCKRSSDPF
ncbi:MAG: FkbM family methyltransferase [Thermosphaera sp.]